MHKRLISLLFLFLTLTGLAHAGDQFLRPDQAYPISAAAVGKDHIRVTWQIAKDYYLYQSKFRFSAENPKVQLGEPTLPKPIIKDDPIFGKVPIYRGTLNIDVPVTKLPAGTDVVTLKVRSQGCSDKGLCFPPHTQTVLVAMSPQADAPAKVDPNNVREPGSGDASVSAPAAPTTQAATQPADSNALDTLNSLSDSLGLGGDGVLTPEQAFQVSADSEKGNYLTLHWKIADGTYLYEDKFKIELNNSGVQLGKYQMPKSEIKHDSIRADGSIGDVAVYHHQLTVKIPLIRSNTNATQIKVHVQYQGCADRGICYPPQKHTLAVALPAAPGAGSTADAAAANAAGGGSSPTTATASTAKPGSSTQAASAGTGGSANAAPVNQQNELLSRLQNSSWGLALLFSLGFGLLVAFTACMYPMIPILTSLILGQGEKITAFRSFTLSLAYTQGIAITFGVLGAVMAVVGRELGVQSSLQTPWILIPSAILFIALALSMFGFYQIQMPSAIQSRLNAMSNKQEGGSLAGVALMGVLSALIVGPCGGPVLLAVLAFAAQSHDPFLGFATLWMFGTGTGLPLLVMGSGGGALLPKAGVWMDTVKATGGVIMLALAISFLERLAPTYIAYSTIMLMWGVLMIVVAVYMGALRNLPEGSSGWYKLWKGLGVALLVYGATFLIGVAAGGKDTSQPLQGLFTSVGGREQAHLTFTRVNNIADLKRELAKAKAEGKPVILDFYADWCTYCKIMEQQVFPKPEVIQSLSGFVRLQADITRQTDADKALAESLNMPAPPAMYFWSSQGKLLKDYTLVGEVTAQQLATRADRAARQ